MAVPMDNGTGGQVPVDPNNPYLTTTGPSATATPAAAASPDKPPPMANTDPVVWGLPKRPSSSISRTPDRIDTGYAVNETNVYAGKTMFQNWRDSPIEEDNARYSDMVDLLRAAHFLGPRATSINSIDDAMNSALKAAASRYKRTGNPVDGDVITFLNGRVDGGNGRDKGTQTGGKHGTTHSGGGSGGGSGGASDSTVVDFTDPGSAHALVDSALSTYLGRQANVKELATFKQALMANEAANPQQTMGTSGGGSSSAVRSGGFNAQEFAKEWAMGQKGVPEYQAATKFLDTFIGNLSDPYKVV
jgi:hypothetical protein